ncbi:MAG: tryptophan-rich sensory protein [Bacilli bacterium]|nr:tryptophan-rich sensory protein [Bacilli bacterium]
MNLKKFIGYISVPLLIGGIVAFITMPFIDYESLVLPPLAPPSFLFPVVWTILYILMGISAYLVSKKETVPMIYYVQLLVNACWSIIFFVFKLRLFAFIWIILLIILVVKMIIAFYKIDKVSAYLQIPYLLWILFAGYLNLGIYLLN